MGAGDYSMRIWLDPEAMRIRGISPAEVYQAIQAQNMEVSAGTVGQPIGKDNANAFQYTLSVKGRLSSPDEFGNIILRSESEGKMLRLKDVARIDLLPTASYPSCADILRQPLPFISNRAPILWTYLKG